MALIQTMSLGSTLKFLIWVSGIFTILLFPHLRPISAQADAQIYRVKRSGEEASKKPITLKTGPDESSKNLTESLGERNPNSAKVPREESAKLYHWHQSGTRKVSRHKKIYEPSQYLDHSVLGRVLKKYVTKRGWVNYRGLKRDREAKAMLKAYVEDLSQMDPTTLKDPLDRLAAWLNLYNAMIILEILEYYPVKSLMQIPDFFGKRRFKIGEKELSIIEIEKNIFMKKLREPRAILARVNGASSGPRLMKEPFKATRLDEQLEDRTWKFLLDRKNVNYDPKTKTLRLNPTFLWYQKEFGDLLRFLRAYLDLLPKYFMVNYTGYDWKLNDARLH